MITSPNTLAPGGIDWQTAMTRAAEVLRSMNPHIKFNEYGPYSAKASIAQAWIAFAREITMHARSVQ